MAARRTAGPPAHELKGIAAIVSSSLLFLVISGLLLAYALVWTRRQTGRAAPAGALTKWRRRGSTWLPALGLAGAALSAWAVVALPGLVYREGFPAAFGGLAAAVMALIAVLFFKRLWILGRRVGPPSPGRLLAAYFSFEGRSVERLTIIVAILFAVPFLAVQLGIAALVIGQATGETLPPAVPLLTAVALTFVLGASGGLRANPPALAWMGLVLGAAIIGVATAGLWSAGGWEGLGAGLALLAGGDPAMASQFSLSGVIAAARGDGWSGLTALSFAAALAGILAAPPFAAWAISSPNPRPFAAHAVWISAFAAGPPLILAAGLAGMGAAVGAQATLADAVVPDLVGRLSERSALAGGALAALLVALSLGAGGFCLAATVRQISGDRWKEDAGPERWITAAALLALGAALLLVNQRPLALTAAIAGAIGLQMAVPLTALCWWAWPTRRGVVWGLAAGIIAVLLSDGWGGPLFQALFPTSGRWPLALHPAAWGLLANGIVTLVVSASTQTPAGYRARRLHHDLLKMEAGLSGANRGLVPVAWTIALLWLFFGVGPGAILGNDAFGRPDIPRPESWTFGVPSLWVWQIAAAAASVGVIWFLGVKLELAVVGREVIDRLAPPADGSASPPQPAAADGPAAPNPREG